MKTAAELGRRGVRRMLVATLHRIERIEQNLKMYEENQFDDLYTHEIVRCMDDLKKEHEKLRHYNKLARELL